MKILILANNDVGLYQFRRELIQRLLKDHTVTAALPYGALVERLREMGCSFLDTPVDRRGINPATDFVLLKKYQHIVKRERPDLVITYTVKPNIYGGFVCRLNNVPYAANITGMGTAFQKKGMLRQMVTAMYKAALKKAKIVFFENSENCRLFIHEGLVRENQTCVLHGAGINLEHYQIAEYPQHDGTTRFLFIGRIMQEKGINELFSAIKKLRNDGVACSLDVLGSYEENYKAQINRYHAEGWLRYHGYQEDVRPYIAKAHCFVLPSWHEGMANTNLECAAMGRPLITSNIPGCREAVAEGSSGFLCEPQNADSLYSAMKKFLSLSHKERAEMGVAGRRRMEDIFDKKRVVEDTVKELEK